MRLLALGLITLALSACSFNKDNASGPDPAIARQNSIIERDYGPYVGTYTGTFTIGNSTQPVRVVLSVISTDAENSDRTPTTRLIPVATLTRLNPPGPEEAFSWSFTPQTSAFVLTSVLPDSGSGGGAGSPPIPHSDDDIKTVSGALQNGRILARMNNFKQAQIGTIDVTKSGDQSSDPDSRNERLRRLYESVAGQYCGTIADPYDRKHPQIISVDLRLTYVDDPTSPTRTRPALVGFYDRFDKPPRTLDLRLSVAYTNPPNISMLGKGLRDYSITFNGILTKPVYDQQGNLAVPGKIDAELFTGVNGRLGTITLKQNDPLCRVQRPDGIL